MKLLSLLLSLGLVPLSSVADLVSQQDLVKPESIVVFVAPDGGFYPGYIDSSEGERVVYPVGLDGVRIHAEEGHPVYLVRDDGEERFAHSWAVTEMDLATGQSGITVYHLSFSRSVVPSASQVPMIPYPVFSFDFLPELVDRLSPVVRDQVIKSRVAVLKGKESTVELVDELSDATVSWLDSDAFREETSFFGDHHYWYRVAEVAAGIEEPIRWVELRHPINTIVSAMIEIFALRGFGYTEKQALARELLTYGLAMISVVELQEVDWFARVGLMIADWPWDWRRPSTHLRERRDRMRERLIEVYHRLYVDERACAEALAMESVTAAAG